MDFLLETLPELEQTLYFAVADLLCLGVGLIPLDTTSTYSETPFADSELADDPHPSADVEGED